MNRFVLSLLHSFIFFCFAFPTSEMLAQSKPASPPSAPYFKACPPGSQWHVSLENRNVKAPGTEEEGKLIVAEKLEMEVGLNRIQRGVITYSDQRKEEFYVLQDRIFEKRKDNQGKFVFVSQPLGEQLEFGNITELKVRGFPAVGWITGDTYTSTELLGGIPCHKFIHKSKPSSEQVETGILPLALVIEAWINASTSFPSQVVVGDILYRFSSITPFRQNVTIPPDIREEIRKLAAQRQASELINSAYR